MLKCTFGSGRLLLTLHNQLLESLHRSWEPVVYRVVADVMPAGNIGLRLRWFPWILSCYRGWSDFWLWHPLFWVVEKMEWVVLPIWVCSFDSNSKIRRIIRALCWIVETWLFRGIWRYFAFVGLIRWLLLFVQWKLFLIHQNGIWPCWVWGQFSSGTEKLLVGFWSILEGYWRQCQYRWHIVHIDRLW